MYSRVLRERECVYGFDLFLVRIFELLGHVGVRYEAADVRLYVGVFELTRSGRFTLRVDAHEHPLRLWGGAVDVGGERSDEEARGACRRQRG
jgi:hypothetical protein